MEQKTAALERTGESIGPGDQIPPGGMTGPEPFDEQQRAHGATATLAREHAPPGTTQAEQGTTQAEQGTIADPALDTQSTR